MDPDNNVHGAKMGPIWVLSAPDGPHVGPMNLAIRGAARSCWSIYKHRGQDEGSCAGPGSDLWPLLLTWFNLNPAWISNYIHCNVWDEITYPFLNFNGATVEV